eukprot:3951022-Prymnesium_polylepis.1
MGVEVRREAMLPPRSAGRPDMVKDFALSPRAAERARGVPKAESVVPWSRGGTSKCAAQTLLAWKR